MNNNGNLLELPFQFEPASHPDNLTGYETIRLFRLDDPTAERTKAQKAAFARIDSRLLELQGAIPNTFPFREKWLVCAPDEQAQALIALDGDPLFRRILYLFNVIVALEWQPSPATYQQIRVAMRRASDFLYDVTNGYMAFGQVVIGGPELMDGADIQIMASNRLHPRAWNNALHKNRKFKGIRVGRGVWQKDLEHLAPWDAAEGYRALIHEWGHYALNINDEYLEEIILVHHKRQCHWRVGSSEGAFGATTVRAVVPRVALTVDASVMAASQISELPPWNTIFATLRANFPLLPDDDPRDQQPMEGPVALPLRLPMFVELPVTAYRPGIGVTPDQAQEYDLDLSEPLGRTAEDALRHPDEAHWLYVLKQPGETGLPTEIIAQGKVSETDRRKGFRLLGAATGDELVLISQVREQIRVQRASFVAPTERPAIGQPRRIALTWHDATPPTLPLFVDVIPQAVTDAVRDPVAVAAQIETSGPLPDLVQFYPAGQAYHHPPRPLGLHRSSDGTLMTDTQMVPHMDGHVLLCWSSEQTQLGEKIFIVSYSQGGGPSSTIGGWNLPITGGSPEGNAMLFFVTPEGRTMPQATDDLPADDDERVRIITTTLTVGPQHLPDGAEARSYIFSLTGNAFLSKYTATLVLYYDRDARGHRGDLFIYRWDPQERGWKRQITFSPPLPYVALPLQRGLGTAPMLTGEVEAIPVERYRIFWSPGG